MWEERDRKGTRSGIFMSIEWRNERRETKVNDGKREKIK